MNTEHNIYIFLYNINGDKRGVMTYTVGEKAIGNPIFPISLFLALKGDSDKFTITFTNDYKSKIVGRAITTLRLMQKKSHEM